MLILKSILLVSFASENLAKVPKAIDNNSMMYVYKYFILNWRSIFCQQHFFPAEASALLIFEKRFVSQQYASTVH